MSHGLGRVARTIRLALDEAEQTRQWPVLLDDDLYRRAFPGLTQIEQKHRVSLLRAAHRADRDYNGISLWKLDTKSKPPRFIPWEGKLPPMTARYRVEWLKE
jgi:hypothetical protein